MITMKDEIILPEGVSVEIQGKDVVVRGPKGDLRKSLSFYNIKIKVEGKKVVLESDKDNKKVKTMFNTFLAHIRNMIRGVQDPYVYKLKIKHVHFPMTVEQQGQQLIIRNFKGERKDRKAKIMQGVDVKIVGDEIVITSIDKELAGQTAANIENATRITRYDRRVFQDGIYITAKAESSEEGE